MIKSVSVTVNKKLEGRGRMQILLSGTDMSVFGAGGGGGSKYCFGREGVMSLFFSFSFFRKIFLD